VTTRSTNVNGYGLRTPAGWWECTLKDVCNGNGGAIQTGPFGSQLHAHDYKDTGTPVVMPQQLGDNQISTDGIARISDEDVSRLKRHCLHQGDIVFSRRGDVTRRAFITEREKGWLCGTGCMLIRPHHPKLCNEYLAYFFSLHEVKEYITKQAVGATMPNLNTGILEAIPLFLPSLTYQQKAVSILTAYDDLIENNNRRIAILEEMAQAIYREWFVNFRFPGHENVKLIDSPLGKIPEGWRVAMLRDVADVNALSIKKGAEPSEVNYVDIASVSTGKIDEIRLIPFSDAPGRARRIVRHGDLIWSTVRPNRRSYSLVLNPLPNMIVSTGFAVISGTTAPYSYLYYALTNDDFVGYLVNHATGSAYPAVNFADFENATIIVPKPDLLSVFHKTTEPMFLLRTTLAEKNEKLSKARDLLLPKLISGQIDIVNLDIATCATVLDTTS
jgi:type I restriction enzyme S subunit